jgi:hypothetical protein
VPRVPSQPPQTPRGLEQPAAAAAAASSYSLQLPPLKAVLIVGPIDGDDGSWTSSEKQNMDLAAAELAANGVTVYKFYAPNNDWEQIKTAARGAQFLFYRGHGIYWSPMPSPEVGGFALEGRFVSSDDIRTDLDLAPNAIVMLYACFSAGTSSNDAGSISSQEAQRRVAMYSDPFLDIGAAGYYADWFGNAFQLFVRYLFEGQTLGQAYESFYDFNASTVEEYVHPQHPSMAMWLDKDFWDGKTQYDDAFAGLSNRTLTDLFGPGQMVVTPSALMYLATPSYAPRSYRLSVTATGSEAFGWSASIEPQGTSWASLQAESGDGSGPVILTMTPAGLASGTYTTSLQIKSANSNVQDGDQTIPVMMRIVPQIHEVYLPIVNRR